MNTGIGDAINLAWKLQAVVTGCAPDTLLDSYEPERIAFARRLVKTTDRVFALATAEGRTADIIRTRVVPILLPTAAKFSALREWLFRMVSQVTINYRDSALSTGKAGDVHGGDRLPWVRVDGIDNYDPLREMNWQVHVYGAAAPELHMWCRERGLPLHVFDWHAAYGKAGLAEGALYLLRPDSYVALADGAGSVDAIARYFAERVIRLSGVESLLVR